MERVILHSDLNSFYASVECLHHPELRDKPVAVGGSAEQRHGIILAKNDLAKAYQIKTGEALWQARQKCPGLVILPPNFPLYLRFSKLARSIYLDYTDRVEPFGIDECWLDVTDRAQFFGGGEAIAQEIRQRIQFELGVTVSIGVSWNKIFAKLGSDYKKPNAVTVISRENYRDVAWPLPAGDLLCVGSATRRKLHDRGVETIGELAETSPHLLQSWFGKMGGILHTFANGQDRTPVAKFDALAAVKSIGNSTTTPRDLENNTDVKLVFLVLAESVAARMREHGFEGRTVSISVRDSTLSSFTRQIKLPRSTCFSGEITKATMGLFTQHYHWNAPVRSLGLSMTDFSYDDTEIQLDFYDNAQKREEQRALEDAVDHLRRRFGNACVRRAAALCDPALTGFDPKRDHIIHPAGYF